MTYPNSQEIQIWLSKAPEIAPERYIADRAYEKGLLEAVRKNKIPMCQKHKCKMVYSQYSFTWFCSKCVEEVENGN